MVAVRYVDILHDWGLPQRNQLRLLDPLEAKVQDEDYWDVNVCRYEGLCVPSVAAVSLVRMCEKALPLTVR